MKLLALPTSPFSARVLIQAHAKGLDVAPEYPKPGQSIAEHAAPNPFARLPVLVVGDAVIIESAAIQEYLEDVHPAPPLRPADALSVARMRALILASDHYLFPALRAMRAPSPHGEAAKETAALGQTLERLVQLMDPAGFALGSQLTLADCALAPAIFYLERFLAARSEPSALAAHPRLASWWECVRGHESVGCVLARLERAAGR